MSRFHKSKKCNYYFYVGRLLFCLFYVLTFIQIYAIISIEENPKSKGTSYLYIYKSISYACVFLSIFTHLLSSFTDPGKIDHDNNAQYVEFYTTTRTMAVKRADLFNKQLKHLIRPPANEDEEESDCSDAEHDLDEYEKSELFSEDKILELNKQFGYNFNICKKCNICRMPGVHHCSICKG